MKIWALTLLCAAGFAPAPDAVDLAGTTWAFGDAKVKVGGHAKWLGKTLHMSKTVNGGGHVHIETDGTWFLQDGSTHIARGAWLEDAKSFGKQLSLSLDEQGAGELQEFVEDLVLDLTLNYAPVAIDSELTSVETKKAIVRAKVDKKHGVVRLRASAKFQLTGTSFNGNDFDSPCVVNYRINGLSLTLPLSAIEP